MSDTASDPLYETMSLVRIAEMNPEGRALIRVNIEDAADVEHLVTVLMGDKVQSRKEYIFENADFNRSSETFERLRD